MTQCKEGRGCRWDMATSIFHGLPKKSTGVSKLNIVLAMASH